MDAITLNAQAREPGKKTARASRREGLVPCVLYGHGVEPVSFTVPAISLKPLIFTAESHRVQISLGEEQWDCIIKEIKFDPVTDRPSHVDFQVLRKGEKLTLAIPIRFQGTAVGQITEGGEVQYILHEVSVTCLPKDIPSTIDVDISQLHIGDAVYISDLDVPGVKFEAQPEQAVVTIASPRVVAVESVEQEAALPEEETEE